jgi:hypothetical protein
MALDQRRPPLKLRQLAREAKAIGGNKFAIKRHVSPGNQTSEI